MVRQMALDQEENGAAILDVNMGMNGIDEKEMMINTIYEVTSTVDCPLCIDSSHVDIIEAALRIYPGRALINSISMEKEKMDKLLPIAKNTEQCLFCSHCRMQGFRTIQRKNTRSSARLWSRQSRSE